MNQLETISERIRNNFESRNSARDEALRRSRELIRLCATAIRASHRDEWDAARELLAQANEVADGIRETVAPYPDLLHAGYTQDALKELVEAHATLSLARGAPIPEPEPLKVAYPAYLNGLCEAASEMRRRCLDELRRGDTAEAERLMEAMDDIYDMLGAFDFPDAITGGLRRRVDQLRGVIKRTRGDLTNSLRQDRLLRALRDFEERIGSE
ncbi:MAG: haloacid dehalogenase [Chloroflexi bacterium]|nr:MAG: haloacid dehalogenase [Chloroflexota bacterium]RLC86557.1 MAG: haloacid dehalogenase [Chloroflexota bacterium]HEY72590.1 haloacid dehalogenase [Thermoflexia bacterium]